MKGKVYYFKIFGEIRCDWQTQTEAGFNYQKGAES
jgi:hypothetical protein